MAKYFYPLSAPPCIKPHFTFQLKVQISAGPEIKLWQLFLHPKNHFFNNDNNRAYGGLNTLITLPPERKTHETFHVMMLISKTTGLYLNRQMF